LRAAAIHATDAMVVEYIRYEVPLTQRDEFLAAYRSAGEQLADSENCVRYEVAEGVEEPSHVTVRIEWNSLEGHEQGFRGSAQFATFLAKVKPFFAQIREMKHYRVAFRGDGAASP
jgi:quinol monooxygenase YgiN